MAARLRSTLVLFGAALIASACEDGPFFPVPDAGAPRDASSSDVDTTIDAGVATDGAPAEDASPDAGPELDAGTDGGVIDSGGSDATAADAIVAPDAQPCGFDQPAAADRDRVVLIGQPFGAVTGMRGTEIRSLTLETNGTLQNNGIRLDVGERAARIEFVPSGEIALVLGEDGELVSVRVNSAQQLQILARTTLPSAGFGDLRILSNGTTAFAIGSNSIATGGVSTVYLGCDGQLTVDAASFYSLRLADSLAFLPGEQRAVILGGQAVFDPVDVYDVRLLDRAGGRLSEVQTFDLWMDFTDTIRIAVSPDGQTLLMPNGSPFSSEGGQVLVARISGNTVTEVDRLMGMDDAREVVFSPDGQTALVSLLQPGRVVVLADPGSGWQEVDRIAGIGLPEQMAMVTRGSLSGLVLVPSVDASAAGSNIALLRITGAGAVSDLGQLNLAGGNENIPGAIGLAP
ncbi:MAG: hypothetical protein IT384_00180 [Deltaproteobacteria bacterium]|nr:hypothetical protein [Deltaproteobacteria bacterium]